MNQFNSRQQEAERGNQVTIENENSRLTQGKDENNSDPKQQFNKLHQIIQDIHSIIESKTIKNKVKEMKLKEKVNELKNKDKDELIKIFNIDAYKLIQTYIKGCTTGIERILLDIFEYIAQYGTYKYYPWDLFDPIFYDFRDSGLLVKIEKIIKDKIENEKKQKQYSNETEQLTRIYIKTMNGRKSDQQMIDIYIKVIDKNIIKLLSIINKLKEENNKGNNNQINIEKTENELQQSVQLIQIILLIREKDPKYYIRIPDQIIKILKQKIYPLIHINCPEYINCTQRIIIQTSPALQELQEAVFQALVGVSNNNNEIRNMLNQDNNFLTHLTPLLISYSTQFQLMQKTNFNQQQNQQQTEYSFSPSFISFSLNFILNQIKNNKSKIVIQIPDFLHSLTILYNYQHNIQTNNKEYQQSSKIRIRSRGCLSFIQEYGDEQDQSELTNVGYGRLLITLVSTAGGSEEQQDYNIYWGLNNISKFIRTLHQGRNPSFSPLPALSKTCEEQIEEEGSDEEIEAQLINRGQNYGQIKDHATEAKQTTLNIYVDRSNARQ